MYRIAGGGFEIASQPVKVMRGKPRFKLLVELAATKPAPVDVPGASRPERYRPGFCC